ncbi:uncharacterized protein LOC110840626 isoform X3 [Zootermopsis nevadensis]|uniref:uncharacterized protein LOC110840626 isoform X3 n=1 Tax=Zootermopsis nevadensis TaxID=136037 RepID=UPI000B8E7337|nr:uncharacterized protein LOC110840626 isoform X3 [Zootermopsis nevadensis]
MPGVEQKMPKLALKIWKIKLDEIPSMLLPCTICNRTFKPESLEKHIKICEKNVNKKRKTFDSSKQRIQGTELAEFSPVIPKKAEKSPVRKSKSIWKEEHQEFVRAIRQARGINEVPGQRSLPPVVAQTRSTNNEKCPHCKRNFGPKAFDRHIEWCKEQKARIPKSPVSFLAKERLEARTKYRAPVIKSKRSLTREKYSHHLHGGGSSLGSRSNSINCSSLSVCSNSSGHTVAAPAEPSIKTSAPRSPGSAPSSQHSSARESLSSSTCGLEHNNNAPSHRVQHSNGSPSRSLQRNKSSPASGLQRSNMPRGSIHQLASSPIKIISPSRKDGASRKGESVTKVQSSQKNSADEGLQDIFSSSCNIARLSLSGKNPKSISAPFVAVARNRNTKNEMKSNRVKLPTFLNKGLTPSIPSMALILSSTVATSEEMYDPYVSAERQMLELLSHGDWPGISEIEREQQNQQQHQQQHQTQVFTEPPVQSPPVSSTPPAPNELRTSPTSAFIKYSSSKPQSDVPLMVDESALDYPSSDFNDLIISGHNPSSLQSPHNISLSTLTSEYDKNSYNINNNRDFTISLSNLSLCSIPDFDFNFDLDINVTNRSSNSRKKYRKKLENAALALQQSVSLYHPGPVANDESQLEIDDVGDSLVHTSETEDNSSPLHLTSSFPLSISDPKPVSTSSLSVVHAHDNSEELNEKLEARKKRHELSKNNVHVEDEFTLQDSHNNHRSTGSKISGDSAYSSLNRKSPMADVGYQGLERHSEVILDADRCCLSSSGSESSLPPLCPVQMERHGGKSPLLTSATPLVLQPNSGLQSPPKLSKFCHECGSKYPVTMAKFCCECGMKRLFI